MYLACAKPTGRKVIDSRWVFRTEMDVAGTIERCKARFVAEGYSQIQGVDHTETWARAARLPSHRAIMAVWRVQTDVCASSTGIVF